MVQWTKNGLTLIEANQGGQQLFIANLHRRSGLRDSRSPHLPRRMPAGPGPIAVFCPGEHRQLVLFEAARDLTAGLRRGFPPPPDPAMETILRQAATDHAARHGWRRSHAHRARKAMTILLGLQDTPGAPFKASDIAELNKIGLPVQAMLDICAGIGMLDEDRTPALDGWFAEQISGLPQPMADEMRTWFRVMACGSRTPPRRRPRKETTIRLHLRWTLPTLRAWAAAGRTSLREISRDTVLDALPPAGNPRSTLGQGLRSIFTILKERKLIFTNPIAGVRTGRHETGYPTPVKISVLREALDSADPVRALMAALLAFHGLRSGQLRGLHLVDIRDGRLHLDQRVIPLAGPVRVRLAAYLTYRASRWPNTVNPHLLVNHRTATRTDPVGTRWPGLILGMPARVIREDRILNEIHATGGDVRRVCDLFGLTVAGAMRYAATLDHPDIARLDKSTDTVAPA